MNHVKGIGAYVNTATYEHGGEVWYPPLTYDWYLIIDALYTPREVFAYLRSHGKKVGIRFGGTFGIKWPIDTTQLDSELAHCGEYISFMTIWEEIGTDKIPHVNAAYDYIKSKGWNVPVYQWPATNYFDWGRLGELKADGLMINPRWWWSKESPAFPDNIQMTAAAYLAAFENRYLTPALETGLPVIDFLYLGLHSDLQEASLTYDWRYSIGQYISCVKNDVPVVVGWPWSPGWEEVTEERLEIMKSYNPEPAPASVSGLVIGAVVGTALLGAAALALLSRRR